MSREVELIIRAKDEASKFVESITDSLKELTNVQTDVGKSAQTTSSLLGKLGKEFSDLTKEANRLTSLGKIADNLDKSAAAVKDLGDAVGSSASEFARLSRESATTAANLTKLQNALDAEEDALKASTNARKQASKELTGANRALAQAERNQTRYNKAVADTPQQFVRPGARSAAAFIAGDVEASRAAQARLTQDLSKYTAEIAQSKEAIATLRPEVQALSKQQSSLADQTQKLSNSLGQNQENLTKARGAFTSIKTSAQEASTALGGMVVSQESVAKSSARVAAEIQRVKALIDQQNQAARRGAAPTTDISTGSTADTGARKAAVLQLRELRKEMAEAQAEAKRLGAALKTSEQPAASLGAAYGQAQARLKNLSLDITELTNRLRTTDGSLRTSQSTFLQWSQAVRGVATNNQQLASSANAAAGAIRPLGSAAQAAGSGLGSAAGGANGFRSTMAGIYGESRQALSIMQRIRGEALALATAYFGLQGAISNIGGVIKSFQTLEGAQSRLGAVFDQDTTKVGREIEFLQRQANRLGIEFGTLADQYTKFAISADTANFSVAETRKVFLSVAEAGRVMKLSQDQLNGVFRALDQIISKGKIQAEELRGQIGDRLSGAFQIFAAALGMTTEELDEAMKKGEVLATSSNLLKFASELDKRFGSQLSASLRGTTAEIGRFFNNLYEAQLLVARGGFIDAFTNALRRLNTFFQSREGRDFFLSLSSALATLTNGLAELPKYFGAIVTAFQVFASVKVAGVLLGLVSSLKASALAAAGFGRSVALIGPPTQAAAQAQTALGRALASSVGYLGTWQTQLTRAGGALRLVGTALGGLRTVVITMTGLFRGLWAAVGGLPGLILTGVTVAIGQWATSIDTTTAALDEHQRQMQLVIGKYEEAKGKVGEWAKELKDLSLTEIERSGRKLTEAFEAKINDLSSGANKVRAVLRQIDSQFGNNQEFIKAADADNARKLVAALDGLKNNSGPEAIKELRTTLDGIAQSTTNAALKEIAGDLLETLRAADESGQSIEGLSKAIEENTNLQKLYRGEITATEAGLDQYNQTIDEGKTANDGLKDSAKLVGDAFNEMGKLISKTGDELKRLETINGLDKQYQDAIKLARTMGQVYQLTDQYNKALNSTIEGSIGGGSGIVDKIIGIESGGNASAKNPSSSATGLGQFIESTWLRMFKQYFPDRAAGLTDAMILELRKNATISKEMVALYVQENAKILKQAGVAVTDANLYLAHFLGPGGATKVLQAQGSDKITDLLAPGTIAANKSILGNGQTVEGLIKWAEKKVGISQSEAAVQKELADIEVKRVEKAREYNSDLERRLALQADENDNAGRLSKEAFVQKALAEEQKRAKEAGVVLDQTQIDQITQLAAKEYEIAQAKRDGKTSTQEANVALQQAVALNQQRNELQRQFNEAQKMGNMTQATALQTQLADVNLKLNEAIEKARAMWTTIGGAEADVALTKLDTLKLKTEAASNSMSFFGLSTQQVGQLANSFADGLVGVFDSFAQAIANGENAVQALGKAFLQFAANFLREIATMILKQMILNALQSFGIPGLGGSAHTGGVVGQTLTGVGNQRRNVHPAIFASAMRYHTGGIAGLRPDEVPTVLKKGEEVLTENDPRHRNNTGPGQQSNGGAAPQAIRSIVVLDEETAQQMANSATNEKAVISFIRKNRATVRRLVVD